MFFFDILKYLIKNDWFGVYIENIFSYYDFMFGKQFVYVEYREIGK